MCSIVIMRSVDFVGTIFRKKACKRVPLFCNFAPRKGNVVFRNRSKRLGRFHGFHVYCDMGVAAEAGFEFLFYLCCPFVGFVE